MEFAKSYDYKKLESDTKSYLAGLNLDSSLDASKKQKIMFIEGPPTMNGPPHLGHLRGRVIKDLWYRYNTIKGVRVIFNGGWDTQGLPVELYAEKKLGITGGKSEILNTVGLEALVKQCKSIVEEFSQQWSNADKQLGVSLNSDAAYWTHKDEFIQREWQILKKANDDNILQEDYTVVAYCPGCQTSLSHSEVNQGYEFVKDPSLYYKVKLAESDEFFIVWTTMPFTLVTDAMIGVNPDEDYNYIKTNNEIWIVGSTRLEDFAKEIGIEYTKQKTVKGSSLEGIKYIHPLLDNIPQLAKLSKSLNYHTSVSEEFVDTSTGTGLVHMSPANGEEDIRVANERGVEIFCPIDDEVKFTKDAGKYDGLFVRDADSIIVEDLKSVGALVKIGKLKHKYPLCWRSKDPIVWLARRGWFYKLDRLDNDAIDAAQNVEYFFESTKNRFLGIIKEKHPWCISRERFWGNPLPVWTCTSCNHHMWFYSKNDIIDAALSLPDGPNFELHRPWIDRIEIACTKCQKPTTREQYVLDTWHNSGSAPYSSLSDDEYNQYIPAPFFTEGIDQTRGWAYTLLIENIILSRSTSPYKSFLFQGHVLDKDGNKMSKSLGNVVDANKLLETQSADLIRLYFTWKTSPIEPLNFDNKEMMSRPYQMLNTLYNMHIFYIQNTEYDKFDYKNPLEPKDLWPVDKWLISKLEKLISNVTQSNDSCRFQESARFIDDFLIGNLSQEYIPMIRDQLWNEHDSKQQRRITIYSTLGYVLKTLDLLMHPICPYITEYLYHNIFGDTKSILLKQWPALNNDLQNDSLENMFETLLNVISVSGAARMNANLKRRWPLDKAHICVPQGKKQHLEELSDLLKSQININDIIISEIPDVMGLGLYNHMQQNNVPVLPVITLNMSKIGPKSKQHLQTIRMMFEKLSSDVIIKSLLKNNSYTFDISGQKITFDTKDFDITLGSNDEWGFSNRNGVFAFVLKHRSPETLAKGFTRDIARRLQSLRKELGFNPTDILSRVSILDLDKADIQLSDDQINDLKYLVRVKNISFIKDCKIYKQEDIDGTRIRISIE